MSVHYEDDAVTLHHGDCREVLAGLPDCSVDSIVTDPPYEIGMMGKTWDSTGIAYDVSMWAECLRVLKPGGHLLSFGGTRTFHRMAVAVEDAGFEIRDSIAWLYGCLDDQTEIMVDGRWELYHNVTAGSRALGYDVEHDEYSWQRIEREADYLAIIVARLSEPVAPVLELGDVS